MKKVRIGFIIFGFIFLALFVITFKECRDFKSRSEKTTATVTGVRKLSRKKWKNYKIYFEYEVNGEMFEDDAQFYFHKSVGDTFTIWYDTINPGHCSADNNSYWRPICIALIAAAFLYFGVERLFRKSEEQ